MSHARPSPPPAVVDDDTRAFIQSGVSISLAAAGSNRETSVVRALGCRVDDASGRIIVLVCPTRAAEFLDWVADGRPVANVFCQPSTNRTLQIKGDTVHVAPAADDDAALVARQFDRLLAQIEPLGVPPAVVRTVFAYDPGHLARVSYLPRAVFSQTPGPRAGEPLGGAA